MNIRIHRRGGVAERITKSGEKLEKKTEKLTERVDQTAERFNQLRDKLGAGSSGKNPYVAPKSTPKTVELKDIKSPNANSKLVSRVRNAGKRRRLTEPKNYETSPDPNPTRLVPKGESVGQKIFSKLKDNRVVNFVKKHPTLSFGALNLAGWGLGAGLAASDRKEENPENTNATTSQKQADSPGFVIGEDGTPYYYNGSNYVNDFIQGSDGNIYSSQGELLGNVGNDARLAGYSDIFDYNAAKAGVDPSQVAAIQKMLGVNVDGKWGARTQAAYQNVLRQIQADDSGIPYTTYNVVQ